MTMVEAAVLFGFGVPIVAACMAFVVMACRMQNEENAKLAAQQRMYYTGIIPNNDTSELMAKLDK